MKHGFGQETTLQSIEGILAGIVPNPGWVFLYEVDKRLGSVRVVTNEFTIEIGESKERTNVFHLGQSWPVSHPI